MDACRHWYNANVTAMILARDTFISLIRQVLHILKSRRIFLASVSSYLCHYGFADYSNYLSQVSTCLSYTEMFVFLPDISLNGLVFEKMKPDCVVVSKWLPNVLPRKLLDLYNARHPFRISFPSSKSNSISYKMHSKFAIVPSVAEKEKGKRTLIPRKRLHSISTVIVVKAPLIFYLF